MLEEALLELTTEPATERATDCGVAKRELMRSASMAGFGLSQYLPGRFFPINLGLKTGVYSFCSVPRKSQRRCKYSMNLATVGMHQLHRKCDLIEVTLIEVSKLPAFLWVR